MDVTGNIKYCSGRAAMPIARMSYCPLLPQPSENKFTKVANQKLKNDNTVTRHIWNIIYSIEIIHKSCVMRIIIVVNAYTQLLGALASFVRLRIGWHMDSKTNVR